MRVALVKLGEPLPIDGSVRLFRCGVLAKLLAEQGHHVTWWTSTFDHFSKKQRFLHDKTIHLSEYYRLELLYGRGYRKNVSFERIRHYRQTARRFARRLSQEQPPHIILCSFPTSEMASVALQYAKRNGTPIVIDIRDHWPDIFLKVVPSQLRWLASLVLWPEFRTNRRLFRQATSLTANSTKQLEWGLASAGLQRRAADQVFLHGYPRLSVTLSQREEAKRFWLEHGVDEKKFNCCFFGAVGLQFDIETIVAAARELKAQGREDIQFIFCGKGSRLDYYKSISSDLDNVFFPGWVDAPEIEVLMKWSKVGLAPYAQEESIALPNKPFEYFFGGLPVLSTVRGELERLLAEHQCGLTYQLNNVESFLSNLLLLYGDSPRRQALGRNARMLFESRFSAERVYSEMIEYLMKVARETGAPAG